MSRIVFLNGSFLPIEEAKVPFMDRGFMFGDGVYEGIGMLDGRLIDNEAHLERLERSLAEIRIPNPYTTAEWTSIQEELARRNGMTEGFIYFQVTRVVADGTGTSVAVHSPGVRICTRLATSASVTTTSLSRVHEYWCRQVCSSGSNTTVTSAEPPTNSW